MTNVVSLTTKEPVTVQNLDDHLESIRDEIAANPGISKAFTVLIDEAAGTWQLHPIYSNMSNGDVFMALRIMENTILEGVKL